MNNDTTNNTDEIAIAFCESCDREFYADSDFCTTHSGGNPEAEHDMAFCSFGEGCNTRLY